MVGRKTRVAFAAAAAFALGPGLAIAADYADPDWPCIQRKVPALSVGQMWAGPPPEGKWRDDPQIRELAPAIAQRRATMEAIETLVGDYADDLPAAERGPKLALLFSGVLSVIDGERAQLIRGIARYAENQTALSDRVEAMQSELATLEGAGGPEQDLNRIEEIRDTLTWETRIFKDRAQSLSYVCETPVLLEQRAFAIARLIAARLSP